MQANNELQLLKDWKLLHVHFYMEKITKASENDHDMKKPRRYKQKKVYTGVWKQFSKVYIDIPFKRDRQITISLQLLHGSRSNWSIPVLDSLKSLLWPH